MLHRRITEDRETQRHPPIVSIGGKPFGRRGDFCVLMGQRKAGKTTVLRFLVATALMQNASNVDTLSIMTEYANGKDVILIDTEGTEEDTQDFIRGVQHIIGADEPPTNFHAYNFRPYTQQQCREATEALLSHHKDAHLIVVDGISDLVKSINNEETSNEIVRWLMASAQCLKCCIVVVIHENQAAESGGRGRGHLGAELERKASGAVGIRKDPQTKQHLIECRFLRKSEDFDTISWGFDKEAGRPVSRPLTYEERKALTDRNQAKISELLPLVQKCFLGMKRLTKEKLKEALRTHLPQGTSTNSDAIRKRVDRSFIAALDLKIIARFESETGDVFELVRSVESAVEAPTDVLPVLDLVPDPEPAPF